LWRSVIGIALASVLDAQGEYEEAFRLYTQAAALRRGWLQANNRAFDVLRHRAFNDDVIATFYRTYIQQGTGVGSDTEGADLHSRHAAVRNDAREHILATIRRFMAPEK